MFRRVIPLLALAWAVPAAAQLTPAQRAEYEIRAQADRATRDLEASWERRSLAGDRSAYFGATGLLDARRSWQLRYRQNHDPREFDGGVIYVERLDDLRTVRGFIGQRQGRPVRLKPLGASTLDSRAGIPLALTLASPLGGEGLTLGIRAVVSIPGAEPTWADAVELEGDEADTYRIEVPALPAGRYELHVEVFYPEEPVLRISSTRTPLVVWQP